MSRIDRYQLAVTLAQEILAGNPKRDAFRLEQAFQDIRDEVEAGRANQRDFPDVAAKAAAHIWGVFEAERVRAREAMEQRHSVKVPDLTVIEGGAA